MADKTTNQLITATFREIPLFSDLGAGDLEELGAYLDVIEISQGAVIINEGGPGDFACFVLDGSLSVLKRRQDGTETVVGILTRGDWFGEMALLDELARSATVQARADSLLAMMTRLNFNLLLHRNPIIGVKILKGVSRTLSLRLRRISNHFSNTL